jgi:hypothetical protein
MTTTLAPATNNIHRVRENPAAKKDVPTQEKEPDLKTRIKNANIKLAQLEVRTRKESEIPSISKQIQTIKNEFKLPNDIEIHFHKQTDPKTGETILNTVTREALKIAEFVSKDHTCSETEINALHKAPLVEDPQKKTSTCTGSDCKPVAKKSKGFFQSLFSTAA